MGLGNEEHELRVEFRKRRVPGERESQPMPDLKKFFGPVLEPARPGEDAPRRPATLHLKTPMAQTSVAAGGPLDTAALPTLELPAAPPPPRIPPQNLAPPQRITDYERYELLLKKQADLNLRVEAARLQALRSEIAGIRARIERLKITPKQLGFDLKPAAEPGATPERPARTTASRPAAVLYLYRDPVTGAIWKGRGKAPDWIRDVPEPERAKFRVPPLPAQPDLPPPTGNEPCV